MITSEVITRLMASDLDQMERMNSIMVLLENETPEVIRKLIRGGEWKKPTVGLAQGYAQANILILPKDKADDFLLFCMRNPKPCALIEVLDAGNPYPNISCHDSDIRYDLNKYRIYEKGHMMYEVDNIANYWRDDLVSFLIGCSFTFEKAMVNSGISIRHIQENKKVSMYSTNVKCNKANNLETNMMVSMRPISVDKLVKTIQITSRFPRMHGAPIHIGNPHMIGINDLGNPDYGDPIDIKKGEIPVFWACGGTVFNLMESLYCDIAITHAPSHMYILDLKDEYFFEY